MAELSDNDVFDSIVSGNPAPELQPEPSPQPTPSQSRDDSGRFATPAAPPAAELPVEPQTHGNEPHNGGNVPVGAVQAEREKRQAAQHEAEALRREIAELRGMVKATSQPAPQPQQEPQPASLFEDPDAYLKSQISPVQQQLQEMREEMWETTAAAVHTADAVNAAKEAANALAGTPQGKALHQHITASGNPFDNLVKWHKQQQAFAKVGDDPEAWLNAEIEKRMQDPTFLASAAEKARAAATSTSSRSQPLTQLPPSLNRLPSGGNAPAAQGDVSDEALFSSVTSGRRG